ncbi:MAG TPA: IclR family transcriptional regulator [Tissierellia bacterium]|jgi:DNA-binding IclR family transcriptional regulator|nr:IclR family transcriptional regulator [Tissierellia bacterium]
MSREKETKTIKSVEKAFQVIDYLSESSEGKGITEISQAMNSRVSATYHLVNTLKELGVVHQNPATKKYKLGLKLWQIGMRAYHQNELAKILLPYLRKLREMTGETVNLTVLEGKEIVYIAQAESEHLLKMFTRIGATAPLHCTGAGKILLAYLPEQKQKQLLDTIDLTRYTSKTIVDRNELMQELAKIKKQGYGRDDEEREEGVRCVGAPVFGPDRQIISCISISGPKERFSEENQVKWIGLVKEIALEATNFLCHNK